MRGALLVCWLALLPVAGWAACEPSDLKSEFQNNPALLADANAVSLTTLFAAGKDADVLKVMNLPRGGASFQVDPAPVAVADFKAAVLDPAEYLALTDHQLAQLDTILGATTVDLTKASIRAILVGSTSPAITGIFANPSATRTALIALVKRQGSRAEVLCGRQLRLNDISDARSAP